ncbi:hypothetical protein B296_00017987 [Ensete ventricosum]|uniref:Integrase zinc-binding domain-containing protein n=1 Tax=Ensete ventricosum TaxID=4639 RepID=A0A426X4G5_ENSVE|nr:hypothetical protein B296_00017987 [Ensete ventricosum]
MGDLVLRKTEVSDPTRSHGKLAPNWEGPYRVIDIIRDGTYVGNNGGASVAENLTHHKLDEVLHIISKMTRLVLIKSKYKRCQEQK